jgi:hypothetical protein
VKVKEKVKVKVKVKMRMKARVSVYCFGGIRKVQMDSPVQFMGCNESRWVLIFSQKF